MIEHRCYTRDTALGIMERVTDNRKGLNIIAEVYEWAFGQVLL